MWRRRVIVLFLLIAACSIGASAQSTTLEEALSEIESDDNFFAVQAKLNAFYQANPGAAGYKQWKRYEWFVEPRVYPSGEYRNFTHAAMRAHTAVREREDMRSTHGNWSFVGPSDWTAGASGNAGMGRLNCIEIHPTDEDIIYVGASNGGVWKTTNGGSSWTNVSPHIPLLSVADIEIDPDNPNRVFVLTGDGDPSPAETGSHGQTEVSSIGIIRSSNGGSTWYPTGFSFGHPSVVIPTKLLMHPTDADIQFVAAEDGIYKTANGWSTFTQVSTTHTYDIEFKPEDPLTMYCSGVDNIRRSTDMGDTWATVSDAQFSILGNAGRVELAVTPDFASVVYAIAGDWDNGLVGFYYSTSSGQDFTWTLADSSTTSHGQFTPYCVGLVAHPDNWIDVYGGMQVVNHSNVSGVSGSWNNIGSGNIHVDIHDMAVTSNALYVANDGGLYKTTNDGVTWTDLSPGLAITEVYRIAGTPDDSGLYYCGTQDNGSLKSDNSNNFVTATGGDGMTCRIDYTDSDIVYTSSQNGNFNKSTDGGSSFSGLSVPGDGSAWITPMIMDPSDPDILFFGKDSVYRSDDGGNNFVYLGMPSGGNINVLAQGTDNRNRLYASDEGEIYRTNGALTNSGPASWTQIDNGVPNLFVSGMAVDPDNANRLWVALSGYTDGEKVYFTADGGASWVNISGGLPNIPMNCIVHHDIADDGLYIGTDIGVFYLDDSLGDWIYFSHSMPAANVNDFYIHEGDGIITAGTFGRGLWKSSLYTGCLTQVNISTPGSNPLGGVHWISAASQITSDAEYRIDLGTEVHYNAGQRVLLEPGFQADGQIFFEANIQPCPPPSSAPLVPQNPTGGELAEVK